MVLEILIFSYWIGYEMDLSSDVELQVIPREVVVDFPFHVPHLALSRCEPW